MTLPGGSLPDDQASAWLARLQTRSVTTAELAEFARWRREPRNAAAYERAEGIWNESAKLSDDPDMLAALSAATSRRPPDKRRRIAIAAFAGVLALAVVTFGLMRFTPMFSAPVYRTAVGERSMAKLDDGSRMQLDADSEVSTLFDDARRRIVLKRGQAFFAVRHDAERPFVVDAGEGLTVTALGTRFDVLRLGGSVRISLVEGSVAIKRDDVLLVTLKPGEVVEVGRTGPAVRSERPVTDVLAWRSGHLSFRDTPLELAVLEMNRYARRPLTVGAATDRGERISGEFSTDDPEGFAEAVTALLGHDAIGQESR